MRMKMIKITNDLHEFREREYCDEWIESYTFGIYKGNTIWYRPRSKPLSQIITILHEIGHMIMDKCLLEDYANLLLFGDFLGGIWDFVNGILRYKEWRVATHENLKHYVKANFRHWWTWERCK